MSLALPIISRVWAMPNPETFKVLPIFDFVLKYVTASEVSVDPFARDFPMADYRNDLNRNTAAEYHMDAEEFLKMLANKGVKADLVIFDPPYSPRQISECYKECGREIGVEGTQNAALYSRVRKAIVPILTNNAIVLSFGWNSSGMGKKLGFEQIEILLCCHGGAHNDTICVAERRLPTTKELFAHA